MSGARSRLAFVLALAVGSAATLAQSAIDAEIPEKPAKYVTDRAGILGAERVDELSRKLEQFERETSNQLLVWVDRKIPERFTLEDFTVRAAEKRTNRAIDLAYQAVSDASKLDDRIGEAWGYDCRDEKVVEALKTVRAEQAEKLARIVA